jgi:hypothetical protein
MVENMLAGRVKIDSPVGIASTSHLSQVSFVSDELRNNPVINSPVVYNEDPTIFCATRKIGSVNGRNKGVFSNPFSLLH